MKILRLLALTGLIFQPLFVYADVPPPACAELTTGMVADFNDDGRVNRKDIAILADYMGISYNLAKRMVENHVKLAKLIARNEREVAKLEARNERKLAKATARNPNDSKLDKLEASNERQLAKLIARNDWKVDNLMARIDKFNARYSLEGRDLEAISKAILAGGEYSCTVEDGGATMSI